MPVLTPSNTVYTHPVAKVMISIPDKLLQRLDARARETSETRSGFLQRLAERELERAERHDRDEIERLLDQIQPIDFGGVSAAQLIREDRESH
ncbi:MAG TPA: type II toxin-antitoxin system HicB family antitoxin [Solirubrobacterales bacterium]|nr:type II toxin-antitoxin system HicB family antitoxin [Solirubrobacterales bacterium]